MRIRAKGIKAGPSATYYSSPIVTTAPIARGEIVIGARCVLCSHSEYTALGVSRPVILRLPGPNASIRIGSDSGLSGTVICAAASVRIGSNVLVDADVVIADTDFHPIRPEGRRYNDNLNDIESAPVEIGDNVFIGAGSVVTGEIPADAIAAGNPARVIGGLGDKAVFSVFHK